MGLGPNTKTYRLLFVEDRLSSQYGQDPSTARRLINFIPSRAHDLKRKDYAPPFVTTNPQIAGGDAWYSFVKDYVFYDSAGAIDRQTIIGVSNNVSTFLYKYTPGGTLTELPGGAFDPPHNAGSGWVGDPVILHSDGRIYISDGFSNANPNPNLNGNWTVYDGVKTWKMGMDIPNPPTFDSSSTPGSIQIDIFREYVITEFDSVQKREGPPSARLRFTPGTPDTYDVTIDMPAGGAVNKAPATASDWTDGYADKWRIYASAIDGSTQMFRIAEIPIASVTFVDTVPFWGESPTTAMRALEPPYRSQKLIPSLVGAKLSNRFAMRDETKKSRLWLTGRAEVVEQDPASVSPLETMPGVRNGDVPDVNLSDFENFFELPDESSEIRSMLWREDGLMVGSEKSVVFFWGDKPENFTPANSTTYNFGIFHKRGMLLTTHGLVMFTSDRKLVLDPAASVGNSDRTAAVIDIGWPIQPELDKTDVVFSSRFQMVHYQFGSERDWLVIAYTTQNIIDGGTAHIAVYDFSLRGFLSFDDVAATCIGVVAEDEGFQFLLGGNSVADRQLKIVEGYDSSASSPYAAAETRLTLPAPGTETRPANLFRTALMDLSEPSLWKVWGYLSYYKKGSFAVVVKAWFDPADIDSLGVADVTLSADQLTSQEFLSWMKGYAKRAVFEFSVVAGGSAGGLQGIEISATSKTNVGL